MAGMSCGGGKKARKMAKMHYQAGGVVDAEELAGGLGGIAGKGRDIFEERKRQRDAILNDPPRPAMQPEPTRGPMDTAAAAPEPYKTKTNAEVLAKAKAASDEAKAREAELLAAPAPKKRSLFGIHYSKGGMVGNGLRRK